jgi:regulator of sigma D
MTSRTEDINSKLEDLKMMCNSPRLFLSNYFFEIKNEIDKNLANKTMNELDLQIKQQINDIWIEMIKNIEIYENKFYMNKLSNESVNLTIKKINSIQVMLDNVSSGHFNQIEQLMEDEEYFIQNVLFSNKTLLLFNDNDDSFLSIKLLIIDDQFISRRGIDFLKTW